MKDKTSHKAVSNSKVLAILFISSLIINIIPAFFMNVATISDEIGTIANGAYFAGVDWSEGLKLTGANSYKYGQALLYTPLFVIFDNPYVIYKFILLINAIIISLIPVIVYKISNKYLEINQKASMGISALIGLLPSSTMWSKIAWSESLMYLAVWLSMLLILMCYSTKDKAKNMLYSFLLGLASVLAYMSHTRGIVVIIATFMVVVYGWYVSRKRIAHTYLYFLGLILGLGIDKILSNYLGSNLWLNRSTNNSIETTFMAFGKYDIFSINGIKTVINSIIAWLYNVIGSSYGIIIIGAVIATICVIINFKNRKSKVCLNNDIISLFSILIFIGSFILGLLFFISATFEILNLGSKDRFDKLIYGRYLALSFGPLILVFYYEVYRNKFRILLKYLGKISAVIVGIIAMFILGYSGLAENSTLATMQLSNLPTFLGKSSNLVESYDKLPERLIISALIILIVCIFVFFTIKKKNIILMTEVISVLFVVTYIWNICTNYIPINNYYYDEIKKTESSIKKLDVLKQDYPYLAVGIPRGVYSYQFAFKDYTVISSNMVKTGEYNNLLVVDESYNNTSYVLSDSYYTFEGDSNVIIKGEDINKSINDIGVKTSRINSINLMKYLFLYDKLNNKISMSSILIPGYTYFSSQDILVSKGKYNIELKSEGIIEADLSIKVDGKNGEIYPNSIRTENNILYVEFNIQDESDNLTFTISNRSNGNIRIQEMKINLME